MITEEQVKNAVNYLGGEFISYQYDYENCYYKIVCKIETEIKLSAKDIETYAEREKLK